MKDTLLLNLRLTGLHRFNLLFERVTHGAVCRILKRAYSSHWVNYNFDYFITGFVTRVTPKVPQVEQELLTSSFSGVFFCPLCCLFLDLQILITPLVSSNSSYRHFNQKWRWYLKQSPYVFIVDLC